MIRPGVKERAVCTKRTKRCASALDPTVATKECCKKAALTTLKATCAVLDKLGVQWWIDYGTLLGWLNGQKFYWNDKDCDVNVLATDRVRVRRALRRLSARYGFDVKYHGVKGEKFRWGDVVKVRLSKLNKANCDVTIWFITEDGWLDRPCWGPSDLFKGREVPVDWVFPTTRSTFEGIPVNVPAQPERLLEFRYQGDPYNLPAQYHAKVPVASMRTGEVPEIDPVTPNPETPAVPIGGAV